MTHESCQHGTYSLTCEEYDALWEHAQGRCELCDIPASEAARGLLYIDHDHNYGYSAVRGLLCASCNVVMTYVDDGKRPWDARTRAYRDAAWFMRVVQQRDTSGHTRSKVGAAKTPLRPMRVPDKAWDLAKARAAREGRTMTSVIREGLQDYASGEWSA